MAARILCAGPFLSFASAAVLYVRYDFKYGRNSLHCLEKGGCAAVDNVEIRGDEGCIISVKSVNYFYLLMKDS